MSRTAETVELDSVPAEEVPRKGDSHAGPEQTRRKGHCDEGGESPQLRLQETARERGLDVCALIDHSSAAEQVGLARQEAELLIFGTAPHTKEN
jgi:hypothetical protein